MTATLTATEGGAPRTSGRKRGNSEGSIWIRKDGRWVAAFRDGSGRRVARHGKTRAEVAAKLAEGPKLQKDGVSVPLEKQTTGEYLEHWLADSAKQTVRPSTFVSYKTVVDLHLTKHRTVCTKNR